MGLQREEPALQASLAQTEELVSQKAEALQASMAEWLEPLWAPALQAS